MPDMDEPVNTDMEPEEALRVLLGEERRSDEASEDRDEDSVTNQAS